MLEKAKEEELAGYRYVQQMNEGMREMK